MTIKDDVIFAKNTALGFGGGAFFASVNGRPKFTLATILGNVRFVGNSATRGGAIEAEHLSVYVRDNVTVDNNAAVD